MCGLQRPAAAPRGREDRGARPLPGLAALLPCLMVWTQAMADGWHNPVLSTPPEVWMGRMQRSINGMQNAMSAREKAQEELARAQAARQGVPVQAEMETNVDLSKLDRTGTEQPSAPPGPPSPEEQEAQRRIEQAEQAIRQYESVLGREAGVCLEILSNMDFGNIFSHEFPNFPKQSIPKCRQAAKQLLVDMGTVGGRVVAGRMRSELMSGFQRPNLLAADVRRHAAYHRDLYDVLEVLAKRGRLSEQDLDGLTEAARGAKAQAPNAMADAVGRLAEDVRTLYEDAGIASLAEKAAGVTDRDVKAMLTNRLLEKIPQAEIPELLACLGTNRDVRLRGVVEKEILKRLAEADLPELLALLEESDDAKFRSAVCDELETRRPKYSEVQDQLEEICRRAGSGDAEVAAAAGDQLANAFQRAPVSHCLFWLGRVEDPLEDLIWEQIDGRIARADAARRGQYRDTALAVLGHDEFNTAARAAALELLARLKDDAAAAQMVELLPMLPREVWPAAGRSLGALTGEDFGPHEGDGIAEVVEAGKRWQAWLREKGKR